MLTGVNMLLNSPSFGVLRWKRWVAETYPGSDGFERCMYCRGPLLLTVKHHHITAERLKKADAASMREYLNLLIQRFGDDPLYVRSRRMRAAVRKLESVRDTLDITRGQFRVMRARTGVHADKTTEFLGDIRHTINYVTAQLANSVEHILPRVLVPVRLREDRGFYQHNQACACSRCNGLKGGKGFLDYYNGLSGDKSRVLLIGSIVQHLKLSLSANPSAFIHQVAFLAAKRIKDGQNPQMIGDQQRLLQLLMTDSRFRNLMQASRQKGRTRQRIQQAEIHPLAEPMRQRLLALCA